MPATYKPEIDNDGTLYTITFYSEADSDVSCGTISYRFENGVWVKQPEDLFNVDEDSKQWARDEAQKFIDEVFPPSTN